jgi:hypothetical protein
MQEIEDAHGNLGYRPCPDNGQWLDLDVGSHDSRPFSYHSSN